MKASNYTFVFDLPEIPEKKLMYNSRTNSLATIETEKLALYDAFAQDGSPIADAELWDQLKAGGFIIDAAIDEKSILKHFMLTSRYSSSFLGLTIAPTSDCNFRCPYCYEKEALKDTKMSEAVQDKIVEFVKQRIATLSRLSITWYGGEPLMAFDVIEQLSEKLIDLCAEHDVEYSAGMVTNGYLLTRNVLERLNELKVGFYQVTLDGNEEQHNKRRYLIGGGATFATIVQNLVDNYDILPRVAIRVNIDRHNELAGYEVFEHLKALGIEEKVSPYLGKVTDDNGSYNSDHCLTTYEFALSEMKYIKTLSGNYDVMQRYPMLKANFCGADHSSALVINADGKTYKCWNDIGIDSRAVGDLLDPTSIGNIEMLFEYMLYDPTSDPMCSDCKILPICMGGCPHYRLIDHKDNRCSVYKEALDNYIAMISQSILQKREIDKTATEASKAVESTHADGKGER